MKRLIQISFATLIVATAGFAQSTNTWLDQWYKTKFGRYSPSTEARLNAEQGNATFPQTATSNDVPKLAVQRQVSWVEQWHKAKYGRYSAAYEAAQKTERTETAFREQFPAQSERKAAATAPASSWREQWYKAKYGRYSPMEEARQRAQGK